MIKVRIGFDDRFEVYDPDNQEVLAAGRSGYKADLIRDAVNARFDEYAVQRDLHWVDARSFVLHDVIPSLGL